MINKPEVVVWVFLLCLGQPYEVSNLQDASKPHKTWMVSDASGIDF